MPQGSWINFYSRRQIRIHTQVAVEYFEVLWCKFEGDDSPFRPDLMSKIKCGISPASACVDHIVSSLSLDSWCQLPIFILLKDERVHHAARRVIKLNWVIDFFK